MLDVGDTAPDFTLVGAAAGNIDTHNLSEYTQRGWSVVLTFYPFDFHPACVAQWCSLRDADWLTILDDVVVLGVGADAAYSHREFAEHYNLQFPILSDTSGAVSSAYDVLAGEFDRHHRVPQRALFVVDADRTIQYRWVAGGPDEQPDLDAVERIAKGEDIGSDADADADADTDADATSPEDE